MRKLGIGILLLAAILGMFTFLKRDFTQREKVKEKPLLKYTFENLKKSKFKSSQITLGTALEEKENHISQMFYYTIRDVINGKNREKKVSGLINVPKKEGIYSVIVMLRGFVPMETYTTALTLLSSLENLNSGLEASYSGRIKADSAKVGIWGHSNGGQIALSVLEITGKNYPTVLWAPVSKPFP